MFLVLFTNVHYFNFVTGNLSLIILNMCGFRQNLYTDSVQIINCTNSQLVNTIFARPNVDKIYFADIF